MHIVLKFSSKYEWFNLVFKYPTSSTWLKFKVTFVVQVVSCLISLNYNIKNGIIITHLSYIRLKIAQTFLFLYCKTYEPFV